MNGALNYHIPEQQVDAERIAIDAAKADRSKFEVLYNRYYETIVRFVYQRLDSKEVAFDITSQVFLKAMLSLDKYEHRGLPFSAWLYRIAINELNMHFRKNIKDRALNVDIESVKEAMSEMETPDADEKLNALINLLPTLPEDELQLIECRFFEKRSFKEMGDIFNITENNAKVKTYRVLEKLKAKLLKK